MSLNISDLDYNNKVLSFWRELNFVGNNINADGDVNFTDDLDVD